MLRSHQGVRHGLTIGGPITLNVTNLDHQKWLEIMNVAPVEEKKKDLRKITKPRPGHADLVGGTNTVLTIFVIRSNVLLPVRRLCV